MSDLLDPIEAAFAAFRSRVDFVLLQAGVQVQDRRQHVEAISSNAGWLTAEVDRLAVERCIAIVEDFCAADPWRDKLLALLAAESPNPPTNPDTIARLFHDTYERLAPEFGYVTRVESSVPWEDVPEQNKALMRAVVAEVLESSPNPPTDLDGIDWNRGGPGTVRGVVADHPKPATDRPPPAAGASSWGTRPVARPTADPVIDAGFMQAEAMDRADASFDSATFSAMSSGLGVDPPTDRPTNHGEAASEILHEQAARRGERPVLELMDALEHSVQQAKEARRRHPRPPSESETTDG